MAIAGSALVSRSLCHWACVQRPSLSLALNARPVSTEWQWQSLADIRTVGSCGLLGCLVPPLYWVFWGGQNHWYKDLSTLCPFLCLFTCFYPKLCCLQSFIRFPFKVLLSHLSLPIIHIYSDQMHFPKLCLLWEFLITTVFQGHLWGRLPCIFDIYPYLFIQLLTSTHSVPIMLLGFWNQRGVRPHLCSPGQSLVGPGKGRHGDTGTISECCWGK